MPQAVQQHGKGTSGNPDWIQPACETAQACKPVRTLQGMPTPQAASRDRFLDRFFQCVYEHASHIETSLLHDFLKTGRAGHVYFGQVVANHVQSYQQ